MIGGAGGDDAGEKDGGQVVVRVAESRMLKCCFDRRIWAGLARLRREIEQLERQAPR